MGFGSGNDAQTIGTIVGTVGAIATPGLQPFAPMIGMATGQLAGKLFGGKKGGGVGGTPERKSSSLQGSSVFSEQKATPIGDFLKTPPKLDPNTLGQGLGDNTGIPEAIKQLLGSGQFGFQ